MKAIGLDIGTTSVCGICCDTVTGEIVQFVSRSNDTFISVTHNWEKQQNPWTLIEKVQEIVAELLAGRDDVVCIGVTGQMHGIVYLDSAGKPVGPLTIWQDGRGNRPYRDGKTYAEWLSEITGYSLATGYGAVTHFYNTVNGQIPANAVTFCTIHDLAVMALTDRRQPLLHPSDAASLGLYDLRANRFDTEAITAASMGASFFPEVQGGYTLAGKTREGIPVSVAIGDNQASVLGSVRDLEHSILVNVGTGSQISCMVSTLPKQGDMDCRLLADNRWILTGSSLCGGRAYAILERFLRDTAAAITEQLVDSAYPAMDLMMADHIPPLHPLVVDTCFSGTRQQPDKRGHIDNIGTDNLTMANLCDGVMNGMVRELYELYNQMKPLLDSTPIKLIGSGNGIRHNASLLHRFSAAFGLPMQIPVCREEAAFGAALFAMVSAKIVREIGEAQKLIDYL